MLGDDPFDETEAPLGLVPVEGRGSLPFALVHGESLLAAASWALTTAGAALYDLAVPWEVLQESGRDLVVHDPLCPLTPAESIAQAVAQSRRTGAVVVGVRPVTDTVKEAGPAVGEGVVRLGATVPRDDLLVVASPVVLPAAVVAAIDGLDTDDLAALVTGLARRWPVQPMEVPALARRVATLEELDLLAALSTVTRQERGTPAD